MGRWNREAPEVKSEMCLDQRRYQAWELDDLEIDPGCPREVQE